MRRIALCADDYGANPAATAGILDLARQGRLSAVSCLVLQPGFATAAAALRDVPPAVARGLHLDLTTPAIPERRPVLAWMLLAAASPRRMRRIAGPQVPRQLDYFEAAFGGPPDFVDGHEHVHQLPGIRDVLLTELGRRYGRDVAIRCTSPRRLRGTKAAIIAATGGRSLGVRLAAEGWPRNADFAGVYDFSTRQPYAARMARWLSAIGDAGLIMCHPESPDGGAPARQAEFRFLAAEDWPALLRRANVRLIPFTARELRR